MEALKVRPHPIEKRSRWGEVQLLIRSRWHSCKDWTVNYCQYKGDCDARGIEDFDFLLVTELEDHDREPDVVRRCRKCGRITGTNWGVRKLPRAREVTHAWGVKKQLNRVITAYGWDPL